MKEYGYEMQKEFERGWAIFCRREARRERVRKFVRAVGRWLAKTVWAAVVVALVCAIGAIVCIPLFLQPWEVGL